MADPDVDLSDLLPTAPLEELILRSARGLPGQPPIEVGLRSPRYGAAIGRPWSNRRMALQRALGGVAYPTDLAGLLTQVERRLQSFPDVLTELRGLPEAVYGGEMQVLGELELNGGGGAGTTHSTGSGQDGGGTTNR